MAGDFDGDGLIDVAVAIEDDSYGGVVAIYSMPGPWNEEHAHWPMLGHDARHTGTYTVPAPNRPVALSLDSGGLRWEDRSSVEDGFVVEYSATAVPGSFRPIAEQGRTPPPGPARRAGFTVFAPSGAIPSRSSGSSPSPPA